MGKGAKKEKQIISSSFRFPVGKPKSFDDDNATQGYSSSSSAFISSGGGDTHLMRKGERSIAPVAQT